MRTLPLVVVVVATLTSVAHAAEYESLHASRPDGRTVAVKGLTLPREAFSIELRSGVVHLVAPFQDQTFAAVFIGDGSFTVTPATSGERQHLRLVTGNAQLDALSDRFERMVFFFTDATAAELAAHAPVVNGQPDPQAVRLYEEHLRQQQKDVGINLQLRVLSDLLNRPQRTSGVFLAPLNGRTYGKLLLAVEPLGISNLSSQFGTLGGEEVALLSSDQKKGGFWYLASSGGAQNGRGKPVRQLADATRYEIDAAIDGTRLRGVTTITFTPALNTMRVLPLNIDATLKVKSAVLESESGAVPLTIIRDQVQTGEYQRLFTGAVGDNDVAVVFPAALPPAQPAKIRVEYEGDKVLDGSNGRYAVRARQSWYPNLGTFVDLADYDITFRYPRRNTLVAVGRQVSERVEGNEKIAVWRSDVPLRVAGFNYGEFDQLTANDADTGIRVNVYTNRDWTPQARIALADAMNASRVSSAYFGKSPYGQLAITQQVQANFGQSWPSLVFLPTLALTTSMERAMALDVDPRAMSSLQEFVNTVGWHEMAHQWWGHQVGWQSYRDQWLSEGFAEFTAALTLEAAEGRTRHDRFWQLRRAEILEKVGNVPTYQAGGITQGFRLSTERSPAASQIILYGKGGYVLHMLRMVMRDDAKGPDADRTFRAMMTDFVTTFAGKSPSTDDFQRIVEKHMPPGMDVMKTGRLDYFFDQWVHGTEIPQLAATLQAADIGGGRYRLSGTITQSGVSDTFHTLVPIYLDFGDNRVQKLGVVQLTGSKAQTINVEVALPLKPRRVLINARNDVLAR